MVGAIVRFGGDKHSCLSWWKDQTSLSLSERQDCRYSNWAAKSGGRYWALRWRQTLVFVLADSADKFKLVVTEFRFDRLTRAASAARVAPWGSRGVR